MSNLQLVARRCPVMGKALAVQSARIGTRGMRAYEMGKARLHTSRAKEARAVDPSMGTLFGAEKQGQSLLFLVERKGSRYAVDETGTRSAMRC
jgi:hypothetical protein